MVTLMSIVYLVVVIVLGKNHQSEEFYLSSHRKSSLIVTDLFKATIIK